METFTLAAVPMMSDDSLSGNLHRISTYARLASSNGAELLLMPEASLTGYYPDRAAELALPADDPALESLKQLSREYSLVISCGFMERAVCGHAAGTQPIAGADDVPQESFYLTQYITDGVSDSFYRKTHLGCREKTIFTPGDDLPVFKTDKAVIGTHLCWESHIPEISGVFRGKGAEIILIPYASGMSGDTCRDVWSRHLPARASDNGVYVAACNALSFRRKTASETARSPVPGSNPIGGGCVVYDPKGRLIASNFGAEDTLLICELPADLPRDYPEDDMRHISYYGRRRPELYRLKD